MLATLMSAGHDPALVMMLGVSSFKRKTELRGGNNTNFTVREIENDPSDPDKLNQFSDVVNVLLLAGLSFETSKAAPEGVGPHPVGARSEGPSAALPHRFGGRRHCRCDQFPSGPPA
jgi:hypothetical protein